jgi:hypothetical protein
MLIDPSLGGLLFCLTGIKFDFTLENTINYKNK